MVMQSKERGIYGSSTMLQKLGLEEVISRTSELFVIVGLFPKLLVMVSAFKNPYLPTFFPAIVELPTFPLHKRGNLRLHCSLLFLRKTHFSSKAEAFKSEMPAE